MSWIQSRLNTHPPRVVHLEVDVTRGTDLDQLLSIVIGKLTECTIGFEMLSEHRLEYAIGDRLNVLATERLFFSFCFGRRSVRCSRIRLSKIYSPVKEHCPFSVL